MLNRRLLWIAVAALILLLSQFTSSEIATAEGSVPPNPQAPTLLVGPISEIVDDNTWRVVDVTVDVSSAAVNQRVDIATVDSWVRIEGEPNGLNSLVAYRVKVLPQQPFIRVRGTLDSIDETTIVVDQISLARTATTFIAGNPREGFPVQVRAAEDTTGSLLALQVAGGGIIDHDDEDDDEDLGEGDVELTGYVQAALADGWQVSGIPVVVISQTTQIEERVGDLVVGAWVKVDAVALDGGRLQALRIRTIAHRERHKLEGTLTELLDAEVIVEGISIPLSKDVKIEGDPVAGTEVEVTGILPDRETGTMIAMKIESEGDQGDDDEGDDDGVRFIGEITAMPNDYVGDWEIGGRTVFVGNRFLVDEHKKFAEIGARARVKAVRQGTPPSLVAFEVVILPTRGDDEDDDDEHHGGHGNQFVRFRGEVEMRPTDGVNGEWHIGGRVVMVDDRTEIEDAAAIVQGDFVKVKGYQVDGSDTVQAREIELDDRKSDDGDGEDGEDEIKITGIIVQLPERGLRGTWIVETNEDTYQVKVTPQTEIDDEDAIAIDVRVEVEGKRLPHNVIKAEEIEVEE